MCEGQNKIHTGRLDDRDRSAHFVSNMQATLRPNEEMTRSTRKYLFWVGQLCNNSSLYWNSLRMCMMVIVCFLVLIAIPTYYWPTSSSTPLFSDHTGPGFSDLMAQLTIPDKLRDLDLDMRVSDWQSESDLDSIRHFCYVLMDKQTERQIEYLIDNILIEKNTFVSQKENARQKGS